MLVLVVPIDAPTPHCAVPRQLEMKSLSEEAIKKRQADLKKMRDLLFYHEIKAKVRWPVSTPQLLSYDAALFACFARLLRTRSSHD